MRRKDKEIKDKEEIEEIIKSASICRLGLSYNDIPYIIPMNFGYKDNCLFFHSAKEGKKLDIIRKNSNICFEIDIETKLIKNKKPCSWGMEYKSIIGFGYAYIISDFSAKKEALNTIVNNYTTGSFEFNEKAVNNVEIIKVEIQEISGKKSGQ
jgi:nitroimidazol reductase NimA-like FMN-containing flavoprotein (pyridoxamine 5'-phosphate oxidase superfamily)